MDGTGTETEKKYNKVHTESVQSNLLFSFYLLEFQFQNLIISLVACTQFSLLQ